DAAFALMADELRALGSPDEAMFYTSGRASNEAAFLFQLFARRFGPNNLPDCSNMCHESSGLGMMSTVGIGKGTVTLGDFDHAKVVVILGQNPGTNHPRMLTALQKAKRNGCTIVAVNPLKEAGLLGFKNPQEVGGMLGITTHLADPYLQVRINGDQAFLQGLMKRLLDRGAVDRAFVAAKTEGFDQLEAALAAVSWDQIVADSGIPRVDIERVAELLAGTDRIIACWAMGLTQHKNSVNTIRDVVNLILMRGAIGKPGAGLCPVRGHSNVQGDRTMGVWEHPPEWVFDTLGPRFGFAPPQKVGFDTVAAIHAMHDGRGKVFVALGGNFLSATPDTEYTAAALRNTRLTAHVSIKLNRSHLVTGRTALILPCLGRTERDVRNGVEQIVTTENSMGVVQQSRGTLAPASSQLLSETAIVAKLATATLGPDSGVPWDEFADDYDKVRDAIEAVVPGFENYNERARKPGGFYLPNPPRDGAFEMPGGKARFTASPLPADPLGPGQLLMMTVRTHDQFNTTVYGLDDRYRGIRQERRVVLMNADDIRERGLTAGDVVDLTGHFRGETRHARRFLVVVYDLPRKCCATYFPEANVLVPIDSFADGSRTPTSKSVVVTVAKAAAVTTPR
ncbi:MAG: FdhF/YdeP family oxidoreductase, partial [Fimbriiglobus sp.]